MSMSGFRLIRFGIVGTLVAGFDLGLIWMFTQVATRIVAVAAAYLFAVALHFWLSRIWVFAAEATPVGAQIPRYLVTVILCWLATIGMTALLLEFLTPNVFLAKGMAIPCVIFLSFVLMRRFVFAPTASDEE